MSDHNFDQRLSQINTQWSVLLQAHRGTADEAAAARQVLMQRYLGAVYRYLVAAVRDSAVADDLTQEFALRFIQGRFGQVDRDQGRFRNYVKASLFRLVQDHYRELQREPRAVSLDADPGLSAPAEVDEQAFRDSWRQELLARAWKALEQVQAQTAQPYYAVLRLRVDQPDLDSAAVAEHLGQQLGRPFTAPGIRQLVHRARERFAELLLDDVRESMEHAPLERVQEELAELNLLKYCQPIIDRRQSE